MIDQKCRRALALVVKETVSEDEVDYLRTHVTKCIDCRLYYNMWTNLMIKSKAQKSSLRLRNFMAAVSEELGWEGAFSSAAILETIKRLRKKSPSDCCIGCNLPRSEVITSCFDGEWCFDCKDELISNWPQCRPLDMLIDAVDGPVNAA